MAGAGVNLFGLDVSGLDVPAFLLAARALFATLALLWLAAALRVRRPAWLLAGVLLANGHAWLVTNYPLQRVYALGPSRDRLGNLALVQVVAAGNSPMRTAQVGQLHFEPFWGLLVSAVSGFDPERVLALYPYLSLAMTWGFALSLYLALRPPPGEAAWDGWERALLAGFATLLASAPLDFTTLYHVPWAQHFLLKPNHALALVLLPWVLRAFSRISGWGGRIATGFLLHLLAWAFVLHMAYVCVGLVVFAAWSLVARRAEARRDVVDVAAVIGVNALVVSPYLVMLLVGYPFLERSSWHVIPWASPHLLEPTARVAPLFLLASWGLRVAAARGDRLGRVWTAQVAGGLLVWSGYFALGALGLARQREEIYFWLRFLLAASAAIGAWDLAGRLAGRLAAPARAAAVAALCVPLALPSWWDPLRMDRYFPASLAPLPEAVVRIGEHLRRHTPGTAVVAADPLRAPYAGALGARRSLLYPALNATRDDPQRWAAQETLVRSADGARVRGAVAPWGVTHLWLSPELLERYPGVSAEELAARPHLRPLVSVRSEGREEILFSIEPASR